MPSDLEGTKTRNLPPPRARTPISPEKLVMTALETGPRAVSSAGLPLTAAPKAGNPTPSRFTAETEPDEYRRSQFELATKSTPLSEPATLTWATPVGK